MSSKKNYIFERVYVETSVDTDGDGKYDLIAVYIKRPLITEENVKVPVLYVANPYMLTCNEDWYLPHDVNVDLAVFPQQNIKEDEIRYNFSEDLNHKIENKRVSHAYAQSAQIEENIEFEAISQLYDHFLERGYAAVFAGGLGTLGSEGITKTGSREEVLAFKAVIDWLNGRARAFTDKEANIEVEAWWTTGKVAMTGKSYLGTMCIGVAATGVEGLETIIPEAAISNWYDYYRYNGLNLPALGWQGDDLDILSKYCFSRAKDPEDFAKVKDKFQASQKELEQGQDRKSGNYNLFWDERNYLRQIGKIRASVFIIHGLNDWNVKTSQCYNLFKELEKMDIPRKMMLHQGEHIYIYGLKDSNTMPILERWLDYYLKGIDHNIDDEARVLVQSNLDQKHWLKSETWGVGHRYSFQGFGNENITILDDLSRTVYDKKKDNLQEWLDELVLSTDLDYKNRSKYIVDLSELGEEQNIRYSGEGAISFTAAIDQGTAILSAMLVDLGKDHRITEEEIKEESGEFSLGMEKEPSQFKVITRGWLNAQNRTCLWSKDHIEEGKYYDYDFKFVATDYTIKKGHKLGLIIYGIDAEATQRPDTVTKITIKEESIKLTCPLQALGD